MFARQLIMAWVLLGILAHSYNSCTCKAEAGGERVPGQPGLPVRPNIKKRGEYWSLQIPLLHHCQLFSFIHCCFLVFFFLDTWLNSFLCVIYLPVGFRAPVVQLSWLLARTQQTERE